MALFRRAYITYVDTLLFSTCGDFGAHLHYAIARAQSQVDGAHAKDINPAQLREFHVSDYSHGRFTTPPTLLMLETK